jgi:hypothetical protein
MAETTQVIATLVRFDTQETKRGTIFKAWDQYGSEWATFTQAVWENARRFQGIPAILTEETTVSRDGRFTNKYLQDVRPQDGAVIAQAPAPAAPAPQPPAALPPAMNWPQETGLPGVQPGIPVAQPPVTPPAPAVTQPIPIAGPEYQRPKHPDEQAAIRRAVALNAAVAVIPHLESVKTQGLTDPQGQILAIAEYLEPWLAG